MGNRSVSHDSGLAALASQSKNRSPSNQDNSYDEQRSTSLKVSFGKKSSAPPIPPGASRRKRSLSDDSLERECEEYGWFEDFETGSDHHGFAKSLSFEFDQPLQKALSLPPSITEPPLYILESSLETQQLW
jgi:hypothetical protein